MIHKRLYGRTQKRIVSNWNEWWMKGNEKETIECRKNGEKLYKIVILLSRFRK